MLDALQRLPEEAFCMIMTQVDARTVLRSRRVCRRWDVWIYSSESLWRSVALQWQLHHLLPHFARQAPTSRKQDDLDSNISSATGYFSHLRTWRDLCQRYLRLTLAWQTPPFMPDWTGQQEEEPVDGIYTMRSGEEAWHPRLLSNGGSLGLVSTSRRSPSQLRIESLSKCSLVTNQHRWCGPLKATMRSHFHVPSVQFNLDFDYIAYHDSDILVLNRLAGLPTKIQVWKEGAQSMAQHEDLVIPSHLGRPLATCMHYPLCAVVAQPGIEHEVSSCYFVLWDVNTRLIKQQFKVGRSSPVDLEFDAKTGIVFVAAFNGISIYSMATEQQIFDLVFQPWYFFDAELKAASKTSIGPVLKSCQIHVGTAVVGSTSHGTRHQALSIRWRSVKQAGLVPGSGCGNTLLSYINRCVYPLSARSESAASKPCSVRVDHRADTMVAAYVWGLMILRPLASLSDQGTPPPMHVALLHYHLPAEWTSYSVSPHVTFDSISVSDGRVLQALVRHPHVDLRGPRAPGERHAKVMDFLITDLDWHRLDPTWRPSEHPFEDVKMWHLEQSVSTDDGIVDDLQEMAIDATTIYTTRKSAGLHFVDFGIAASMKAAKEDKLRLHAGAGSNFDSPWREAARI